MMYGTHLLACWISYPTIELAGNQVCRVRSILPYNAQILFPDPAAVPELSISVAMMRAAGTSRLVTPNGLNSYRGCVVFAGVSIFDNHAFALVCAGVSSRLYSRDAELTFWASKFILQCYHLLI